MPWVRAAAPVAAGGMKVLISWAAGSGCGTNSSAGHIRELVCIVNNAKLREHGKEDSDSIAITAMDRASISLHSFANKQVAHRTAKLAKQ